jgi:hypothetical protein
LNDDTEFDIDAAFDTRVWQRYGCPNCGEHTVVTLLLGSPVDEPGLWDAVEQGDLVLGGCVIDAHLACESPDLACTACDWSGIRLYDQLFSADDLLGVLNAHAQYAAELWLLCTGLATRIENSAVHSGPPRLTPGDSEMLQAAEKACEELAQNATDTEQIWGSAGGPAGLETSPDCHRLLASTRHQSEGAVTILKQQLAGLAQLLIGVNATANDDIGVEIVDRAASEVLRRHPGRSNAAAALEASHAVSVDELRVELAGKICVVVMMDGVVMSLTDKSDKILQFGWRSDPLGDRAVALWELGIDPLRTWQDPLRAIEVVEAIFEHLTIDDDEPFLGIEVSSLAELIERSRYQ